MGWDVQQKHQVDAAQPQRGEDPRDVAVSRVQA